MTEKQDRPREYDAVLGGKNPPPVNAAVLGGIEGAKLRLAANDELVRVGAVREAMKYGEAGLDLAIASLNDKSPKVRQAVLNLLEEKLNHPKVKALLGKELKLVNNKLINREEFETVTVNEFGKIIKRKRYQAEMFAENLGEGIELEMVSIPGESFLMGSPEDEEGRRNNESPQHRVLVPPFFLGKYPVTQIQYEAVMGKNPSLFKGANRPVEQVSWNDATDFCWLLSQKTGKTYRLPSEAEWEYACRAGTTTPFYFGPTITTDLVNYDGNRVYGSGPKGVDRGETTNVGSFPPNAFGLYDMHGNVYEWCQDVWHQNYNGASTDGSAWESGRDSYCRMLRGGSWGNYPRNCRCANRLWLDANYCFNNWGFRVVLLPGV